MSEHVTRWLAAYQDRELTEMRLRQVEDHLAVCPVCQAELDELASLSTVLRASPPAETRVSPDRFVAQVQLRLPRRPTEPTWRRALERAWQLVPAGLLGAWAVIEAVFLVASLVLVALQLGLGGDALAWLAPTSLVDPVELPGTGVGLQEVGRIILQFLSHGGLLGWGLVLNLVLMIGIGLLYWSWLATWWARRRSKNLS